jgi:hypothetical protein
MSKTDDDDDMLNKTAESFHNDDKSAGAIYT